MDTIIFSSLLKKDLLYFFGYKTDTFSFQNNTKNLDPSSKMDLDLWHCLGRVKLIAKFNRTDLVICSLSRDGTPHLIAE